MNDVRITFRETRLRLAQDRARIRTMLAARPEGPPLFPSLHPTSICVLLHRLAHYFYRRGMGKVSHLLSQLNLLVTGADMHPFSDIGGGLLIPNPGKVVVSGRAGRNLTIRAQSGMGLMPSSVDVGAGPGLPVLGNEVTLGPVGGVLGPVRIGDGVCVRPGCIVCRNVPADAVVERCEPPSSMPAARRPLCAVPRPVLPCEHRRPSQLVSDFRMDVKRYLDEFEAGRGNRGSVMRIIGVLLSAQIFATAVHRLSHLLYANGLRRTSLLLSWLNVAVNKITISPASCIGGRLYLPHPGGVVFNGRAGSGLTMYACSLCTSEGGALTDPVDEGPILGSDVILGAMSAVIGRVDVGDCTRIGFRVNLLESVPSGGTVLGGGMQVRIRDAPNRTPRVERARGHPTITWRETRQRLAVDRRRLREASGDRLATVLFPSYTCVWLHRNSCYLFCKGRRAAARFLWLLNTLLTGADIDVAADLGAGLVIPHPAGIRISGTAGRNLTVMPLAGIAAEPPAGAVEDGALPVLGDDVTLGHHAWVVGPVTVGNGVRISPGCRVLTDVADHANIDGPRSRFAMAGKGRE